MTQPRNPQPTIKFIDEYCALYQNLFPEVRSFENFRDLHLGIVANIKRKSLPEIAKVVGRDNGQSLHHFLTKSPWEREDLKSRRLKLILSVLNGRKITLIIDETGDQKQGRATDYVKRQYKDSWRFRPNVGWYQWTGRYWKHNDSGSGVELEGELIKFINANSWIYQGSSNLTSLVRQLNAKLQKADWESPYKLAFSNGTLNLKTGEFIPAHHRDDFLTSSLPYEFDPNAQCPKWLQFLNEALGGDQSVIGLLQAFFKWIVTPKTSALKIEKCLDLIGQPGTGKGTTLDILHAFAGGTENCAVIDSDTFNKSGENLASLLDKKVSIDSDASGFISNIGLFCKVVSNEPVRSRKLYKDTMNVRLNTVIVRAYNRFLDVQGATEALNRRIIAIPFDIKPDQPDIGLRSQLLEELPGIFAWAWSISEAEMKRRILWPGDSPAIASASTRRFEANNPEFTFLREIFPDGNEAVQPRGLYSTYKDWCKDVGISPKKERNFYDTIRPFGCEQGNKSDGYRHFSIPPMKDFDIMAHIGMRQPEKNTSAKKVLPLVSPYLPMPCPEQVSAPSFLPDVSPPISPSDSGRNQGETKGKKFLRR